MRTWVDLTLDGTPDRGWFDPDQCELVRDGHAALYRTPGGRYVSERPGAAGEIAPVWLTAEQARAALERMPESAERARALSTWFAPKRRPGKPRIGGLVRVVLPDELIAAADAEADRLNTTRSDVIRDWAEAGRSR